MIIPLRCVAPRHFHFAGLALLSSLGGCWEVTAEPSDVGSNEASNTIAAQGGSSAVTSATGGSSDANRGGADPALGGSARATESTHSGAVQAGGAQSSGSAQSGGGPMTSGDAQAGGDPGAGGSTAQTNQTSVAQTGGLPATSDSAQSGGKAQTVQSGGSPASGGDAAGGSSNGTTAGGTAPAGGTTSLGDSALAGAGGGPEVLESICADEAGGAMPYDYSMGLLGEYAFELSMSCDVGGYLMPLVLADPVELSQVNAFVMEATDWYRAEILKCADTTSSIGPDNHGLLPLSQSSDLSAADVDASTALFLMVIDRHDTQPDAVSATKKEKIKHRLKSVKARAVHNSTVGFTKTLTEPDCIPAAPNGG